MDKPDRFELLGRTSPCERPSVLGHCRQKLTRSGNDFQSAGPHVRQHHLAVEILNSLPNKLGLTIQINNSFLSNNFTKIVLICSQQCTQAAIFDVRMFKTRLPPGASTNC